MPDPRPPTPDPRLDLRYTRERAELFWAANRVLENLRIYSRALKDRRAFSIAQYEYANREINTIGKMLGGWMKDNAKKAQAARKAP